MICATRTCHAVEHHSITQEDAATKIYREEWSADPVASVLQNMFCIFFVIDNILACKGSPISVFKSCDIMKKYLYVFVYLCLCIPQKTPGPGAYEPCWKLGDPLNTEALDPSFSLFFRNTL